MKSGQSGILIGKEFPVNDEMKQVGIKIVWGEKPLKPFVPPLPSGAEVKLAPNRAGEVCFGGRRYVIADNGATWEAGPELWKLPAAMDS